MKYYIIAGEASGDMHAANMMKQLKLRDPDAYFRVWGGDNMAKEAQELAKHIRETSFMGVFAVVSHLKTIKANFTFCEEDIMAYKPDVLILIDNSGFNLRIAKFVKNSNLPTRIFYYILPQAWAWKRKRVHTIQGWTDRRFSILPFEPKFYESYGYKVDYVGHPILDAIAQRKPALLDKNEFLEKNELSDKPIIALLPGSRKREIRTKLPKMLRVVKHFPDYQFVVAGSETMEQSLYDAYTSQQVKVIFGQTYDILNNAKAALVTSGTATLETALFKVPQVVCYKPGLVTFYVLKGVISINHICMVNLILDRRAVTELIESDLNEQRMTKELKAILAPEARNRILTDYEELETKLGGVGASKRVAELMIEDLKAISAS
ncbi:lipid-A-disaccharide synthase [Roseivirga misakiensis]|uniref:Lipid-A-disaccharide synthase n=1 Tax=Roseivirga misakiensis TaxID=1563681 RepID=A0A1E5T0C4_9BACT|nr:lipid-A-disaccharide synthase [Roseivirga misakiensis]OEK04824.1 lipid-A-disaccharide synthase [Roseivirga misakiensis]